jgi:hypothetical protein
MIIVRPSLLALILWVAATPVLAADPGPPAKGPPDAATQVSPLAAQPLDRFSVTRDRPLFSPTRRPPAPPPVVVAAPPPPPPPPNVVLLGVVMDGESALAIVRAGQTQKDLRVGIGDDIGGWKVGQIESGKLVLLLDGRTATFIMFAGNNVNSVPNASAAEPQSGEPYRSTEQKRQAIQAPEQQHQAAPSEPVAAPRRVRSRQAAPSAAAATEMH